MPALPAAEEKAIEKQIIIMSGKLQLIFCLDKKIRGRHFSIKDSYAGHGVMVLIH